MSTETWESQMLTEVAILCQCKYGVSKQNIMTEKHYPVK